jgi:hypothetical protein
MLLLRLAIAGLELSVASVLVSRLGRESPVAMGVGRRLSSSSDDSRRISSPSEPARTLLAALAVLGLAPSFVKEVFVRGELSVKLADKGRVLSAFEASLTVDERWVVLATALVLV